MMHGYHVFVMGSKSIKLWH